MQLIFHRTERFQLQPMVQRRKSHCYRPDLVGSSYCMHDGRSTFHYIMATDNADYVAGQSDLFVCCTGSRSTRSLLPRGLPDYLERCFRNASQFL